MSPRKPVAALAAVTAALAVAVPVAGASAATTAPAVRTTSVGLGFGFPAGSLPCQILVNELRFAALTGNVPAENFLGEVFVYSRCGGAAI